MESEFEVVVRSKELVAEGVARLVLVHPNGADLPAWAPGAHLDLILGQNLVRQYSLCGDPNEATRYEVAVLREPAGRGGSAHVHERLAEGDRLRVRGPRNNFALAPADRYLFIAGGVGDRSLVPYVTETQFLGPNSTLLKQPDHFQLLTFRPHPTDPARSWMEMRLMVTPQERSGMDPEKWTKVWDKNWEILLAVLHQEDFPLLRASQTGMASRDAGSMVLGRNEVANQVFHRETRRILSAADHELCPPAEATERLPLAEVHGSRPVR